MIRTILIPIDGSPNSANAVDYGIYIAPKLEAALTGLHVIDILLIQGPMMTDISTTVGMPPYDGFFETIEASLKEKADLLLKDFEDRCRMAAIPCRTQKNIGKISDAIIEESENADLILMAKKGEHFHVKEGGVIGSVAEIVIRHSGKPVMVIGESFQVIESMGLAYDGSAPSRKALELSMMISEKASWPITVIIVSADKSRAAELSAQVEETIQQGSADCEVIISTGREADEILKFIKEGSVELMVMGAYGHNRLRELLLGSTTSQVIRKSPIPVLLIR